MIPPPDDRRATPRAEASSFDVARAARPSPRRAAIALGLVVLVAAIYAPVRGHEFLDFDDGEYVAANPQVLGGFTVESVRWAFTTTWAANWHPLTWLSHMADVELFGVSSAGAHLTNVVLHGVAALLVFALFDATTGRLWRSGAVAALFAAHPLRVESVAWVSQRKDVLAGVFFLLACLAWVAWVRRGGAARYGLVAAAFAAALLSKPTSVTLPCALLLLDVWPLRRLTAAAEVPRRLCEKLPLFALAAAGAIATYLAQSGAGATASIEKIPPLERALNGLVAFVAYLGDTFWPTGLSCYYPHPLSRGEVVSRAAAAAAAVLLVLVSVGVARAFRSRPFLAVGWLWYVVTLVPMIGLVQVGFQARADRYTYLPHIGLLAALVWLAGDAASRSGALRRASAGVLVAAVLGLAVLAHGQTRTWKDRASLYGQALAVDARNWLAWNNLGVLHLERGDFDAALGCFERSARIRPEFEDAWYNAGVALMRSGQLPAAVAAFEEAVRLRSDASRPWINLGIARLGLGHRDAGVAALRRGLALEPGDPIAIDALARAGALGETRP